MKVLDLLFHIIHLAVIFINLFLWIPEKTRKFQLVVLGSTLFSWLGGGLFYGFGYCFLTDWQWQVKSSLGESNLPRSYITYLTNNLLGLDLDENLVEMVTFWTLGVVLVATVMVHIPGRKKLKDDYSARVLRKSRTDSFSSSVRGARGGIAP